MKIEQEYLTTLLAPLEDHAMPTIGEYLAELEMAGIVLTDNHSQIDRKFERHLKYLCTKRMISNADGCSDLKSMGFILGAAGHLVIVDHGYLMKIEKEDNAMTQNITIGTINSEQIQVGNENNQTTIINIHEIVETVAASKDLEAKFLLKNLLENSTVASVIGASVSGLITLLR